MALEASLGCESNINSLNKEITEAAQKSAREASRPAERGRMTGACGSWQQLCPISFLPVNSARKPVRDPQRGEGGRSGKATGREQSPGAARLHGEAARRPQNVHGWDVGVGSWASPTAAAAGVAPASEGATEQGGGTMEEVVEEERVPQVLHLGRGSWDIRGDTQTHVPAGLCTPRWLCSALGTVLWYSQLSPVLSGRGCSKDRKTQKHPQLQRTLCCRLQPEGGRGRSSARIRAANFPFPKNFTGIAGVKGQLGRFQRDASTRAGWAAEQLEGSILGEPTQLQAGTHSGTHVDGGFSLWPRCALPAVLGVLQPEPSRSCTVQIHPSWGKAGTALRPVALWLSAGIPLLVCSSGVGGQGVSGDRQ